MKIRMLLKKGFCLIVSHSTSWLDRLASVVKFRQEPQLGIFIGWSTLLISLFQNNYYSMWWEVNSTCLVIGILLLNMHQEMLGKIKKNPRSISKRMTMIEWILYMGWSMINFLANPMVFALKFVICVNYYYRSGGMKTFLKASPWILFFHYSKF